MMDRRISKLTRLREADQRYWRDVVRFRWFAALAFIGMTAGGYLPYRMPWFAFALALLVFNQLAYTLYRRRNSEYTWYQDVSAYLDVISITLVLISIGTIDHPMWMAYVLVIPAVANFKRFGYNIVFSAFVLLCFGIAYAVADVALGGRAPFATLVVIAALLILTSVNSIMISANNFRLREVIHHQASTDALTGLANRRRLFEVLEERNHRGQTIAVMMIDIDDFKLINETHGHLAADEMLSRLGDVFTGFDDESSFTARYGGDEFVLLADIDDPAHAGELGQHLIDAARDRAGVSLSVGIALYPSDATTPERALQLADQNLRTAKANGKAQTVHHRHAA